MGGREKGCGEVQHQQVLEWKLEPPSASTSICSMARICLDSFLIGHCHELPQIPEETTALAFTVISMRMFSAVLAFLKSR